MNHAESPPPRREEQAKLWSGASGQAWVALEAVIEETFKDLKAHLVEAVWAASARRVLDVGCGAGGVSAAIAAGPGVECVGVDISEPMIGAARANAERLGAKAAFIRADAATYAFEPESFDMIVSRFGVMFFEDSAAAFANLRRAAKKGAPLRFVCWRGAEENPFMTAAERAARPLLPDLPEREPDAPGQFAFADSARVYAFLRNSGWEDIDIRPFDAPCAVPARALPGYVANLGPVGRYLQDKDEALREKVLAAVLPAFDPYRQGEEIRFTAACWTAGARA